MIEIKKRNEPRELLEYRRQDFAAYADMPSDVKKKVIDSLLSEQGHLCAYCMSRIDNAPGKHKATIEHCIPQAASSEKERLNYRNMLAVCQGNRNARLNADKTCDAKRGSLPKDEQIMKKIDIFNGNTLVDIQYSADGTIFSENPDMDEDLNKRLNLNCEARRLKECRLQALHALHSEINQRYPNKTAPKKFLKSLLVHYTEQSENKSPYSGIIIAWLNKRVKY